MKTIIAIAVLAFAMISFKADKDVFVGKILYKYAFTDLNGNDITENMASFIGREQHYFIGDRNYKAYDEKNNWVQLYHGETNSYYFFNQNKTAKKFDGATQTSKKYIVTKPGLKETIAGYACESIQVETDNGTTIYFFTENVKTDPSAFSKHNFGGWNKYLASTDGAICLKFIMTDRKNGYIWTSVATEITKQDLTANDFEFPKGVRLTD